MQARRDMGAGKERLGNELAGIRPFAQPIAAQGAFCDQGKQ